DEIADDCEKCDHQQHDQMRIIPGKTGNPVGDDYGAAQIGEEPPERIGRTDGDQRQRENQAREAEIVGKKPDMPPVQRGNNHKKYVDYSNHPSLGRREPARENAAQKYDGDHQRQRSVLESAGDLTKWSAWALYADRPEEIAKDHEAEADHKAGY